MEPFRESLFQSTSKSKAPGGSAVIPNCLVHWSEVTRLYPAETHRIIFQTAKLVGRRSNTHLPKHMDSLPLIGRACPPSKQNCVHGSTANQIRVPKRSARGHTHGSHTYMTTIASHLGHERIGGLLCARQENAQRTVRYIIISNEIRRRFGRIIVERTQ